jgi:hypothetical protein
MQFAATFDVKITFGNPADYAGFAADFAKLYEKYCSGAALSRQEKQAAVVSPDEGPPPALPPAPLSDSELPTLRVNLATDADVTSAPKAVQAFKAIAEHAAAGGDVLVNGENATKRKRRTKAEMEAARAAEAAKASALPKAHGNGNAGTTAPAVQALPDAPPMPTSGPIVMPEGEITPAILADMFGRFMMLKPDPLPTFSMEVMAPLGISRVREAKPEQYRALCEGMARIAASLS